MRAKEIDSTRFANTSLTSMATPVASAWHLSIRI